jgi:hypothetical protein
LVNAHVADPGNERFDSQLARHSMQSLALGPIADDPYFQLRDPATQ